MAKEPERRWFPVAPLINRVVDGGGRRAGISTLGPLLRSRQVLENIFTQPSISVSASVLRIFSRIMLTSRASRRNLYYQGREYAALPFARYIHTYSHIV